MKIKLKLEQANRITWQEGTCEDPFLLHQALKVIYLLHAVDMMFTITQTAYFVELKPRK